MATLLLHWWSLLLLTDGNPVAPVAGVHNCAYRISQARHGQQLRLFMGFHAVLNCTGLITFSAYKQASD